MEAQEESDEVVSSIEKDNDEQVLNQQQDSEPQGNIMRLLGMCNELFRQKRANDKSESADVSNVKNLGAGIASRPENKTWQLIQKNEPRDVQMQQEGTKNITMPKLLSIRHRRVFRRQEGKTQTSAHQPDYEKQETSSTATCYHDKSHVAGSSISTKANRTHPTLGFSIRQEPATVASRRASRRRKFFQSRLKHLSRRLQPLVRVTTGQVHPAFPKNILSYHLLNESDLDSLADFYHQRIPSALSRMYPCPVNWIDNLSIEDKRRNFGTFIGLSGLRSPTITVPTVEQILEDARRVAISEEEAELNFSRKGRI